MKRFVISLVLIVLMAGLVVTSCGATGKFVSIGTRTPGSTSYAVYVPVAAVLNKYMDMKVAVEPTGGFGQVYHYLKTGELQFCADSIDQTASGYFNKWFWDKGRLTWLRIALSHYFSGYFYGVRATSDIRSFKDLEGKKLMTYSVTGPAQGFLMDHMLEKYGVTPAAKLKFSRFASSVQQLVEGKVDVISYSASASAWIDADRAPDGLRVIFPNREEIDYINKKLGAKLWSIRPLPPGYLGLKALEKGGYEFGAAGVLTTSSAVPDDVVYQVVKIMFEHQAEYKDAYPKCAEITLENALEGFVVPIHPGAIKYYKEKGIWTAEHEAFQEQVLKK